MNEPKEKIVTNGKGDCPRSIFSDDYLNNYQAIDWHKTSEDKERKNKRNRRKARGH